MRDITKITNIFQRYYHRYILGLKRAVFHENLIVIVATAHKVGSTWLYGLLYSLGNFVHANDKIPSKYIKFGTLILDDGEEIFDILERLNGYVIFKSHSYPTLKTDLSPKIKFISIYRDPRDVIISSIFYLASLAESKGGWGNSFKARSEKERIIILINEGDFLLTRLEKWFYTQYAYKVKYENLKNNCFFELVKITKYLGLNVSNKKIQRVILENSFKVKIGRSLGNENSYNFLRKGIVGDWKNYFDQDCIKLFKTAKSGRWNSLLINMGYENSTDW